MQANIVAARYRQGPEPKVVEEDKDTDFLIGVVRVSRRTPEELLRAWRDEHQETGQKTAVHATAVRTAHGRAQVKQILQRQQEDRLKRCGFVNRRRPEHHLKRRAAVHRRRRDHHHQENVPWIIAEGGSTASRGVL